MRTGTAIWLIGILLTAGFLDKSYQQEGESLGFKRSILCALGWPIIWGGVIRENYFNLKEDSQ